MQQNMQPLNSPARPAQQRGNERKISDFNFCQQEDTAFCTHRASQLYRRLRGRVGWGGGGFTGVWKRNRRPVKNRQGGGSETGWKVRVLGETFSSERRFKSHRVQKLESRRSFGRS